MNETSRRRGDRPSQEADGKTAISPTCPLDQPADPTAPHKGNEKIN